MILHILGLAAIFILGAGLSVFIVVAAIKNAIGEAIGRGLNL